jgi:nucleoside-diphosphate-sugar epimerase
MNLVTGASGFIGSHVVDRLIARGEPVRACVRKTSDRRWLEGKPVELATVDLQTGEGVEDALKDVRVVFHIAGVTGSRSPEAFRKGNCEASIDLATAALRHAPALERFVFVSSLAAAGPAAGGIPLTEESPRNPVSSYGESKRDAEAGLERMGGLPLTVVRPPIVFGPRDTNLLGLFKAARFRVFPVVGLGRQQLSFVYGEDLAEGIVRAGLAPAAAGRTYFLTGPRADWREAHAALKRALGRRILRLPLPKLLVRAVGELFEWKARLTGVPQAINRRKVREMFEPAWTCSGARAQEELGFEAATGLEEGFRRTAAWYREAGWI